MAGVHLASLYELDHNEFNRLIEQVVLPRKEEYRYLLYFTVSRDKTVANHVMKCMVQGNIIPEKDERDFWVDVSFESQDLDTAAFVRDGVSSLDINEDIKAHTVAGFIFTGMHLDVISLNVSDRELGPTISHDVVEIICSAPSLKCVKLERAALHSDSCAVLAKEGNKSKVQTLILEDVKCPTSASSHHLADAVCSMPNVTELTLRGKNFQEEFFTTLNAKASILQVQVLRLTDVKCPTSASSHHLVDAVCSMPNLTKLTLHKNDFQDEFLTTLNAKASTLQVQTVFLWDVHCPTSVSSHHLADALWSMPKLAVLILDGNDFQEKFFSTLNAKASTLQVQILGLENVRCPTSASSHHLAEAVCSMPNLTYLTLRGKDFQDEFFPTLNAKASTLQLQALTIVDVYCPNATAIQNLAESLCSMPKLTNLNTWKIKVEQSNKFYSTLKAKALSVKDSFPQARKGNFSFQGNPQANFDSFLQSVDDLIVEEDYHLSDEEPMHYFSDFSDEEEEEEDDEEDEEDYLSAKENDL